MSSDASRRHPGLTPSTRLRRLLGSARARCAASVALVLAGCCVGGLLATWTYSEPADLSVGRISLSVSPFHRGALDAYVPLADWGVRFPVILAPARLKVELQSIDRTAARRVARQGLPAVGEIRGEARDAIVVYLLHLALLAGAGATALGALVAAALRARRPRLRWMLATSALGGVAWAAAVGVLLAPRGRLDDPVYYAHGSDIPVALSTVEAASRASGELGAEVDNQFLGLARLVVAPGNRVPLAGLPRLTIASDLHNNVVAIPTIRSAAAGGPVLLAGDLTDRGTALETRAIGSVAHVGKPVVMVPGNHDSDDEAQRLAEEGVIVLTHRGRLLPDGRHGSVVVRVAGLRVAGYESPNMRTSIDGYADHGAAITPAEQRAFARWLAGVAGRVDVVMVHEPQLAEPALRALRADPPAQPLLVVAGHTHQQAVVARGGVVEVNGGTAGAGGTGNLTAGQQLGLAVAIYRPPSSAAGFAPLAADLIQVDPGTGGSTARRIRLDQGPVKVGDPVAPPPKSETDETTTAGR
ncbi:MAG TPA: metallophosphoesterase [Solirubrobacteraceae bacterium]|nr:metallophosphoesterase [Solirubrobacteraceae bacterium]